MFTDADHKHYLHTMLIKIDLILGNGFTVRIFIMSEDMALCAISVKYISSSALSFFFSSSAHHIKCVPLLVCAYSHFL